MLALPAAATRTLAEAVLVVLLGLPPYSAEPVAETGPERTERLTAATIAVTESSVARPANWEPIRVAAVLLAIGWHESRFARYVGTGQCHRGRRGERCGADRRGRPVARSYWQLERRPCPPLWHTEPGTLDATRAAARCASRLYVGAYYRCGGHRGAFAGYARGNSCEWAPARGRARWLLLVESRLRTELARPVGPAVTRDPLDARLAWLGIAPPVPPAAEVSVAWTGQWSSGTETGSQGR